jgi:predicted small lipoprotein YifL
MRLVLTLCLLLAVAACGAKGPLYLPDEKPQQKQNK